MTPSSSTLRKAADLQERLEQLQHELDALLQRTGEAADGATRRPEGSVAKMILLKKPAENAVRLGSLVVGFSMSLPQFDPPGPLFEDVGSIVPALFDDQNRYRLFAQKVWPVLVGCREQLAECYTPENGRPALEPVVLLGVLILQFLERAPDRQAVEMVRYHLG